MLARIAEPERQARDRQRQMRGLRDQRDLRDLRALGAAQTSAQIVKKRPQRRGRYYFLFYPDASQPSGVHYSASDGFSPVAWALDNVYSTPMGYRGPRGIARELF